MLRRPPRSTRTDPLFPHTSLFRSWRACEEVENCLPNGWHARLRRWSRDSFFSVPRPGGGGTGGKRRQSLSSRYVGVVPSRIALRNGRDRKSVVSGKSVSVRVDLGGRRIINKKKYNYNSEVFVDINLFTT